MSLLFKLPLAGAGGVPPGPGPVSRSLFPGNPCVPRIHTSLPRGSRAGGAEWASSRARGKAFGDICAIFRAACCGLLGIHCNTFCRLAVGAPQSPGIWMICFIS